jgi:hypothetical protein
MQLEVPQEVQPQEWQPLISREVPQEITEDEGTSPAPDSIALDNPVPTKSPVHPSIQGNAPVVTTSGAPVTIAKTATSLRRRLENTGLTREQAEKLLMTYNRERIEQQLSWLPYRKAKNPAGYLLAAIEGHYREPLALRQIRTFPGQGSAPDLGTSEEEHPVSSAESDANELPNG